MLIHHRAPVTARTGGIAALAMITTALFVAPSAAFGQKGDKEHHDAFRHDVTGEARLIRDVRHQLLMLPYYGVFDDIAFRIDGSTVVLLGQVTRPTLKSDADGAVKHVEGVERVINQIEVLPPSPNDDRIRIAEYRAIYGDPALSTRYGYQALPSIHIIVKDGRVTLEGVVANQGDKDLVNIRANGVPGVFEVANRLEVEP